MENIDIMKDGARRLADYLERQHGLSLKHGQALSALSAAMGERDWKTLRAALSGADAEAPEPERYYEAFKQLPRLGKCRFTVFIEAHSIDDYGDSPGWLIVDIDEAWLESLTRLSRLAAENKLDWVQESAAEYWDDWERFRLDNELFCVTAGGSAYWETYPKHAGYHIESKLLSVEDLGELLRGGLEGTREVLYYGMDPLDPAEEEAELLRYRG